MSLNRLATSILKVSRPLLKTTPNPACVSRSTHSYHSYPRFGASQPLQLHNPSVVYSRRLFSSTPICPARYVRFGGDPQRPWDISKWDMTTKVIAGLAAGGVFYFVSQYAFVLMKLARLSDPMLLAFLEA